MHRAAGREQDMASYSANGTEKGEYEFILDSGASGHLVKDSSIFLNKKELSRSIVLWNGKRATTKLCSNMKFTGRLTCGRDSHSGSTVLKNILFVAELEGNLMSCSSLGKDDIV